jgi:hypothetical protein
VETGRKEVEIQVVKWVVEANVAEKFLKKKKTK